MMFGKKILSIALAVSLILCGCGAQTMASTSKDIAKTEESASQEYVNAMYPGWNLGNTFDGYDTGGDRGEESWGNPKVTKELIAEIKNQGFNSIRMPITTEMRIGGAPDYTIDPTFLDRYAEVVNWALDEDLYVIIDLHHDSWIYAGNIGSDSDNGASLARFTAIWTQLAEYFKDYPETVSFEGLNEPQFWTGDQENQIEINREVNDTFYQIVRNSGGANETRMLLLPTLNTNDAQNLCDALYEQITSYNDENLIATFHYYGYWPFSTNIAGTTTMDETVVKELEATFDRVANTFTKNGIGVICGEYGLLGFDKTLTAIEHGEVLKYFDYINYYASKSNITLMLWDNGQHFGRTSLTWSDPSLYAVIASAFEGIRSSYTASDRIFIDSSTSASDYTIALFENGNELTGVSYNGKTLTKGTDYEVTDDAFTIKASFLKQTVPDNYGQFAELILSFNQGPDWSLYLNYTAPAVVGEGSGNTTSYTIPVEMNGNVLSTLEAVTSNGGGIGPQNWTSYKEYDYAFTVDYTNNTVTFTSDFFAEATDAEVMVTFHFQNGTTAKTSFTIAGNTVTDSSTTDTVSKNARTDFESSDTNSEKTEAGSAITYTVVKGDCLYRIAKRYFGDGNLWTKIYEWNKDSIQDPDLIFVGQELILYQ